MNEQIQNNRRIASDRVRATLAEITRHLDRLGCERPAITITRAPGSLIWNGTGDAVREGLNFIPRSKSETIIEGPLLRLSGGRGMPFVMSEDVSSSHTITDRTVTAIENLLVLLDANDKHALSCTQTSLELGVYNFGIERRYDAENLKPAAQVSWFKEDGSIRFSRYDPNIIEPEPDFDALMLEVGGPIPGREHEFDASDDEPWCGP